MQEIQDRPQAGDQQPPPPDFPERPTPVSPKSTSPSTASSVAPQGREGNGPAPSNLCAPLCDPPCPSVISPASPESTSSPTGTPVAPQGREDVSFDSNSSSSDSSVAPQGRSVLRSPFSVLPASAAALTLGTLISRGAAYLARHGVSSSEAPTQAEILAEEATGFTRGKLLLHQADIPDTAVVDRLREMLVRVAKGEPLQYVVGHWPFCGAELKVAPCALIPRPETEGLVERILRHPVWRTARFAADIGTGTGAIAIALALAAKAEHRPVEIHAIDLSPEALNLARNNAVDNGVKDLVFCDEGNGASGLAQGRYDFIVSNPPYIASADVDALPPLIRDREPRLALDGGPDGLDVLRQIILDATQALRPGGRLFLEIGEDQGLSVRRLLERAGYGDVVIARDLAGHDRYAEGSLP